MLLFYHTIDYCYVEEWNERPEDEKILSIKGVVEDDIRDPITFESKNDGR